MKKRKRDLIIIYDKIDDPKSINAQLVTSYMNRFIIDEAEQIEIKEVIDYREKSYPLAFDSKIVGECCCYDCSSSWQGTLKDFNLKCASSLEFCFVLTDLYQKLKQSIFTAVMPCSPGLWSLLFETINVIQRNLTNKNSYLHYIIGIDSDNNSFPVWFRHLKQSFGIDAQFSSTYFTFLGGKRMDIIEKKKIQENQSSSIFHDPNKNLRNFWKSLEPSQTIGDDIDLLFDQMRRGSIQTTKYQLLQTYYMLSEKNFEKVKSPDNDYLYSFLRSLESKHAQELLDGSETVFLKCEGTRTTLE